MRYATLIWVCMLPFIAACEKTPDDGWLGYIEGESALIAPPQPGWIVALDVTRGQNVEVGDLLFALDDTKERAARDNAAASIHAARAGSAQAQADLQKTAKEVTRQGELAKIGGTPQREVEQAQAASASARARLSQNQAQENSAKAQMDTADFNLSERAVRARVSGRVEDIYFRAGEYANAGVPVLSVLPPQNIYVRFFVPEEALQSLHQGTRVHVGCDGCPQDLQATVSFIASQSEFTPPIIYSVRNRSRLVFKVEAHFEPGAQRQTMRPGLPVDVRPIAEAP